MAAARDIPSVAHLHDPLAPAVLRLVAEVARTGTARGVEVSVCGEAASLPAVVPALLAAGVRVLSVPPSALGRTKAAVAAHSLGG
jgi:phosphotransferase system enzyme I (PtsI)